MSKSVTTRILLVWIVVLSLLYSALVVVRHNTFQSGGFDLGLYDQTIWLYSQFKIPYNTVKDQIILGDHLNLTLPFIAPILWIWNDVRAILILQVLGITTSLWAVYKLVLARKFPPFVALGLTIIYSLFYGIQYGLFFDFHSVLLGVALIPWLCWFFETKKWPLFWVTLILLVLTQENMGLALASLGFIYIWKKEYRFAGVIGILGGVAVSLVSAKIITLFPPHGFQYTPHISFDPRQLFNAPEKQQVWLYTLSSFSFLPLFSPGAIMAVTFDLAQYFMTGPNFARMWSPFMHHRAILVPYLLLGTLDTLTFLKAKKINLTIVTLLLLVSVGLQQFLFHYPLNKLTKPDFWRQEQWMRDDESMIREIPPTASVATQQSLVPHLSHRDKIYLVWPRVHDFNEKPCGHVSCWWLDFGDHPDYLLIDTHPAVWLTMLLETPEHVNDALANMEKMGKIQLVKKINDVRLYKVQGK